MIFSFMLVTLAFEGAVWYNFTVGVMMEGVADVGFSDNLDRIKKFFSGEKQYFPKQKTPDHFVTPAEEQDVSDSEYKDRCVLVGVVRNTRQFDVMMKKRFYHIPISQVSGCFFPVKYVAVYQSKKQFGGKSGIKYFGEVEDCQTLPRNRITEMPKSSNEKYLYFKIRNWYVLDHTIKANEMEQVAFSTTPFLLKTGRSSAELQLRSKEEHTFYTQLTKTVNRLVRDRVPDGENIVYRDFTVKLRGGLLYLYFADVLEYVIGYDLFLEKPTDVIRDIFDYYPEI